MKQLILSLSFLMLFGLVSNANIIYVNASATGNNDGTTWANAYTDLNFMTTATATDDSIFVAQGVYKPATGSFYETNFSVSIYGGFPATANPTWSSRDWVANPTICDGDNNGDDGSYLYTDNAKRLFYFGAECVIDGFTIQNGGNADAASCAGIWITKGGTIKNCTFLRNKCVTSASQLTAVGGAILARDASIIESDTLFIENCTFRNNAALTGGAISSEMNLVVRNCRFGENAANNGPAIGMVALSDDTRDDIALVLEQSVFFKNGANRPALYLVTTRSGADGSTLFFKSNLCTYYREYAIVHPVMNNASNNFSFMTFEFGNNIVQLDSTVHGTSQTVNMFTEDVNDPSWVAQITINNSGNNLCNYAGANPNTSIATPVWASVDTTGLNFILDCTSPGRDVVTNTVTLTTDILGNPRMDGTAVDYGAFESQCNTVPNSVKDVNLNSQLQLYPNPTRGTLHIDLGNLKVKDMHVYDITGKRLKTFKPNQSIEVSNLPEGLYILMVETDSGNAYSRFIKE